MEEVNFLKKKVGVEFSELIDKAVELAKKYYGNRKMNNGNSYLEHALEVAKILADWDLDANSIVVAIIHHAIRFAVEDGIAKDEIINDIKKLFDEDILMLIEMLEKIFYSVNYKTEADAVTKYILKGATDLRVIFIRLADKIANARTVEFLSKEEQERFADKLIKIYSPLAEYLNLPNVKAEFDEVGFSIKHPNEYQEIKNYLEKNNLENIKLLEDIKEYLEMIALETVPNSSPLVFGRIKSPYSIFRKMQKYSEEGRRPYITEFKDILAFTIIVETVENCYQIASSIINISGWGDCGFKDYISDPKPNGFKEIQVIAKFPEISEVIIEIQILTLEMYQYNTYGPASHFAYKLQSKRFANASTDYAWVERVKNSIEESLKKKKDELKKSPSYPMKSELFTEQTFVWTPKEELIDLPTGSTVLDFAFRIHTDIAFRAESAIVNGKRVPLNYVVQNGDKVEIIQHRNISKRSNAKKDWLDWVKTSKARDKIAKELSIN